MLCQVVKNKAGFIIAVILLMFSSEILAGWIIHEKSFESGSDELTKYTYYIQDQRIKLVEDDLEYIFDLNDNSITFIIPSKLIFWKGTADEYNLKYKEALEKSFEEKLKNTPEEKVKMARATYEYYIANIEDPAGADQVPLDMLILNTGQKGKIAGQNSIMYGLYVNKDLRKEFWISNEININSDLDIVKFNVLLKKIGMGMMDDLNARASEAYAQLLKSGFLMKTVEFGYELSFTTEVYKVKQKKLKQTMFLPHKKYREATFSELDLFSLHAF